MRAPITRQPISQKPPSDKLPLIEIFEDVEQGSDEWLRLRLGVPTASCFAMVMADGRDGEASKMRERYKRMLAGELMTGIPAEGKIVTAAMQRGKDMEEEARQHYFNTHFVKDMRRIGFMRRRLPSGRYAGCSPDALIGSKRALEIKTMAPDLMIELLEKGAGLPPQHKPQVQGTLWIGDLEEVDLIIFYRNMPVTPKFTIMRDERYIAELDKAVQIFEYEVRRLAEKWSR